MQKIKLRGYTDSDGILKLALPTGLTEQELDITVTVKSVNHQPLISESFQAQMLEKLGFNPLHLDGFYSYLVEMEQKYAVEMEE